MVAWRQTRTSGRVASLIDADADADADADGDGTNDEITFFIYAGWAAWQMVEEYPSAVPTWDTTPGEEDHDTGADKSYVYGLYIDEVLSMRDHLGADYFYLQDDLYSVYALADAAGAVVERYEYGDYGEVSVTAEDGTARSSSAYGNRHTFTGRLLDDELTLDDGSQILQYRNRFMATGSGRFLQRDPIEHQIVNNYYTYVQSTPFAAFDPFGRQPKWRTPTDARPPDEYCYRGPTKLCRNPKLEKRMKKDCDNSHDRLIQLAKSWYRKCRKGCSAAYKKCMGGRDPWDADNLAREKGCDLIRDLCQDTCRASVGILYKGIKVSKALCYLQAERASNIRVPVNRHCPPGYTE